MLPLGLALGLFSCDKGSVHHVEYGYAYGTNWEIHLYEGESSFGKELMGYVNATSRVLDLDASSCKDGIYALNHDGEVEANPFLLEAIELGLEVSSYAHDAYNIYMGKLTASWLEALEDGHVLDSSLVGRYLEEAKNTTLSISGKHVSKVGEGQVDLGSLGKGLCLNHLKAKLEEKGIHKYLINAGTSSLLIGENSSDSGETKVILEDASGKAFVAKDIAISSSSISRQKYEVDGKVYSHIVDPRNGVPSLEYDALCLKGEDAGLIDALSTAYLVLGKDYLNELGPKGIEYCLMKSGEVVYESQGFFA